MFNFFRRIRAKLLGENKIVKYILYALGEIFLVTIGILIAVKINNVNQNRQQEQELQAIYTTVKNDIVIDSVFLFNVLEAFKGPDSVMKEIIFQKEPLVLIDTITKENVKDCLPCQPLHLVYQPFSPNLKGYEALKRFDNNSGQNRDTLTQMIIQFYSQRIALIEDVGKRVGDEVIKNVTELEKYPWYASMLYGEFNIESVRYFLYDEEYKNKLATYRLLNISNYHAYLRDYHLQSRELINEIDKK